MKYEYIKGFNNRYIITEKSDIFNLKHLRLKKRCRPNGYYYVVLCKDGKQKKYDIHRLMAIYFIANPYGKAQVNHINGIKSDNSLENLEWVSARENIIHAHKLGIAGKPPYKKIIQLSTNGMLLKKWDSIKEASEKLKILPSSLSNALKNKTISGGYKWNYV